MLNENISFLVFWLPECKVVKVHTTNRSRQNVRTVETFSFHVSRILLKFLTRFVKYLSYLSVQMLESYYLNSKTIKCTIYFETQNFTEMKRYT